MSPSNRQVLKSVLLVDDEDSQLKLYSHLLSGQLTSQIETARLPTGALHLAERKLFDIILIDVTIKYNGSSFGGLELYKQLVGRYGNDSLVVYSKYIDEDMLKQYPYPFNFVEIGGGDPITFAKDIASKAVELRRRQRCFVAMPFGKEYIPIWRAVSNATKAAFFKPVRVDKERFSSSIVDRIIRELREAKLVLFVTVARNPNVFYEAGFAHALGKEIITITDEYSSLPFDIRDRNAIAYGKDLQKLERLLGSRLRQMV